MNEIKHFNNSFSDTNIISIDSNTSSNEANIKYIKVPESSFNCIKNDIVNNGDNGDKDDADDNGHADDDDNLSQFSGFSYYKDYEYYDNDVLEQNLEIKTRYADTGSDLGSELDSELDFKFDFDIVYNTENNYQLNSLIEIKTKIANKIKLTKKDFLHIQYSDEGTKFELIKLFNHFS
jgi:hypothetical protein